MEQLEGLGMRHLSAAGFITLLGLPLLAQTLSPREVFYGQGRADSAKTSAAAKKKPAPATSSTRKTRVPDPAPAESAAESAAEPPVHSPVMVDYAGVKTGPLGLRYSVKRLDPSGDYSEVDGDTVFHTGDRICVVVETNDAGYLYVVHQGSSGKWETMYPTDKVDVGSNKVERGKVYRLPSADGVMSFYDPAGTEKLFVILTREPERDLEKLIYSMQDRKSEAAEQPKVIMAQSIQNELIERLRNAYSRDLVIEKVDDSKAPPSPSRSKAVPPERMSEKAVYVLNPKAGPNARVVADIKLSHQ